MFSDCELQILIVQKLILSKNNHLKESVMGAEPWTASGKPSGLGTKNHSPLSPVAYILKGYMT